jgi:hypothetical protein
MDVTNGKDQQQDINYQKCGRKSKSKSTGIVERSIATSCTIVKTSIVDVLKAAHPLVSHQLGSTSQEFKPYFPPHSLASLHRVARPGQLIRTSSG